MTSVGTLLGTAAYMSPEQARGRAADKRSDVWAFGCVLYEMVTGSRAFPGDSVAETLALVLTKDPDWLALPSALPAAVRTLLQGCLAKDPRKRVADASVAEYLLDERNGALLLGQGLGKSVFEHRYEVAGHQGRVSQLGGRLCLTQGLRLTPVARPRDDVFARQQLAAATKHPP